MYLGQRERREADLRDRYGEGSFYTGDVGAFGYQFEEGYSAYGQYSPFPVGYFPPAASSVPYIPPLYPREVLPEVRPSSTPVDEDSIDRQPNWLPSVILPEIPVFYPEPVPIVEGPESREGRYDGPVTYGGNPSGAPIPGVPGQTYPYPDDPVGPTEPYVTEEEMAVDWGDFTSTIIQQGLTSYAQEAWGPTSTGYAQAAPLPGIGPVVLGPKGKPCKRRRRRRLLTESDFNDLMRIATLPNKQNVAVALAKAVGRR